MSAINHDVKLSEFSKEQLDETAKAVDFTIMHLEEQLAGYYQNDLMKRLMADKIRLFEAKVENLRTVHAQLLNACALKEIERRVSSN